MMAEVLAMPQQFDGSFSSSGIKRSTSQTSLSIQTPSYTRPTNIRLPSSLPSSAPSSPRLFYPDFSAQPSYISTPSSSVSLDEDCQEEELQFPSYNDAADGTLTPPPTPAEEVEDEPSDAERESTPVPSPSKSPEHVRKTPAAASDDLDVRIEPSRHVDYLSHEWDEEDIWQSFKHIKSKGKEYKDVTRLENAAWRTWAKRLGKLSTVSPDKLNWLKDTDVTWLYGPLQSTRSYSNLNSGFATSTNLSRANSFANHSQKKPILKRRSPSEIMLQKSLSSSTLMKQAVDALRAKEPLSRNGRRPQLGPRTFSEDYARTPRAFKVLATPSISSSSSGVQTPCERRIHFNDKVEQCIAINECHEHDHYNESDEEDAIDDDQETEENEDSDDGIMMATVRSRDSKERKLRRSSTPRGSFSNEGRTIAMLPSTTLKYRSDTPEPLEAPKPRSGGWWNAATRLIHPSPSQETLRPRSPSSNFLIDEEDEEDLNWQPSSSRNDDLGPASGYFNDYSHQEESELLERGMRRTPSGMFMPYEEDEDDIVAAGLFGKVVDTVNTAKDIAHVIWNVGWRK